MKQYQDLEEKIGIKFKNYDVLQRAFVHRSHLNETDEELKDNERLEFLGDAVLELISTKHLFENYPQKSEGEMTAFRSALVKGKHLAEVAEELALGEYLMLSRGEEKSGGRSKKYILANTLEALIGAIYIDLGHEQAEEFIEKFILTRLDDIIAQGLHIDAKSQLQEIAQEKENFTPYYEVVEEVGPDHKKHFTMGVYINDKLVSTGEGPSKQKAEDAAAKNALTKLKWI